MSKVELNEATVQEWLIGHEEDFTNKFVVNWLVNHLHLLEDVLTILHKDAIDTSATVKEQSYVSNSELTDASDSELTDISDSELTDVSDSLDEESVVRGEQSDVSDSLDDQSVVNHFLDDRSDIYDYLDLEEACICTNDMVEEQSHGEVGQIPFASFSLFPLLSLHAHHNNDTLSTTISLSLMPKNTQNDMLIVKIALSS